ncbi:MAG: hypothetical protein U9P42_02950 [Candidatus Fermentibacteria bacterium]|nr:hypothetical protein [Candidatus Fermentibacteria bacterium]
MKHALVCLLVFAVTSILADGSLDAVQSSNSNILIMAMRNDGVLFTYTLNGWQAEDEPCPGTGPFCVQLYNRIDSDDGALVFVIDSRGTLFQTNGEWWHELIGPPDTASVVSLGSVFRLSDHALQVALLDNAGIFHINGSDHSWFTPFAIFPAAPARDMSFNYDSSTDTMTVLVIGSDGLLYADFKEKWRSADKPESAWNIQNIATYVDNETGGVLLVAFDDSGRMYTNTAGDGLVLTTHEPCPGAGPWDIDMLYTGNGMFDILCLDTTGGLYRATEDSWITLADSFPNGGSD